MTQNIYDTSDFFKNYSELQRSKLGLSGAPEWNSIKALIPSLQGRNVLDLGCGFGWFSRWAAEAGATEVLALDVSKNMLQKAQEMTQDSKITYQQQDLEHVQLSPNHFDFAYSSLAFHYIENLQGLFKSISESLKSGASFVFSVEHPIYMAPSHPSWIKLPSGEQVWPVDQYLDEGRRTTDWLAQGVVKQHRTLGTYLNLLIESGFKITHVNEWGPSQEQIAEHPEWAVERDRPMFLIIAAENWPL